MIATSVFALKKGTPLGSEAELEIALRDIGATRYHNLHPFHKLLHGGKLNKGQVQAWALNRYYYQSSIPIKDAVVISRFRDRDIRLEWRHRSKITTEISGRRAASSVGSSSQKGSVLTVLMWNPPKEFFRRHVSQLTRTFILSATGHRSKPSRPR